MIPRRLVTHTAAITRQGTTVSAAGDSVPSGVYASTGQSGLPCIAEQTAGDTDAAQAREPWRATWSVLLDPGVDVVPRDLVTLTGGSGPDVAAEVSEVRRFDVPARMAHVRLDCREVVG